MEAGLTSESYILSKDCELKGGCASCFWFGKNEHSGDFAVTLGGYHPAFKKPAHYPMVPRLGLAWNINKNLQITGEIYFALTPSVLMTGGKLSAVYSKGNLKAWFIAYADFMIGWKPYSYQASIGVTLGASYRIDLWLIHKTFSIEMAADLKLWGPEIQGELYVSWFIISFTISFSKGEDHSKEALDWNGFKESFLMEKSSNKQDDSTGDTDILTIQLEGVIGQTEEGIDIVNADTLSVILSSKIPVKGNIRPVGNAALKSEMKLDILGKEKKNVNDKFIHQPLLQNVPAALWKAEPDKNKRLKEDGVIKDAVCGIVYTQDADSVESTLFPKTQYISLDELYKKNTFLFSDSFTFGRENRMSLSDENAISRFMENEKKIAEHRKKFLEKYGILEMVDISELASNAESWMSENILIKL